MNRNDFCGVLEELSKKYDLEIELLEEPFTNPILMVRDSRHSITCNYDLGSFTHSDFTRVLNDIKWRFNLKRRDDGLDAFLYSSVAYDKCFKPKAPKPVSYIPKIEKVIFNEPATIILWADGTKTVVKCQEGEGYDPEKGLAMAISKKALGNKGNYCEVFKKWLPEEEVNDGRVSSKDLCKAIEEFAKVANKHKIGL